jgi:Bacterial CdiA-CT RNAse A domain
MWRHVGRLQAIALIWLCVAGLIACKTQSSRAERPAATSHDLAVDEAYGGHTLERHVGRTDAELRERLQREPNISAASSYTDRATAERSVGAALAQNANKIERWLERGPHRPNLVVDYTNPNDAIGRVMYPRAMGSVPCDHAIVVLRADGDSYYVLTSYPECQP